MISAAERLGKEIKIKRSRNQRREIMSVKIALAGNPNCGKTTLFNALTGSNQFVGNWPGVTVEKKEGKLKGQDGFCCCGADTSEFHFQYSARHRWPV